LLFLLIFLNCDCNVKTWIDTNMTALTPKLVEQIVNHIVAAAGPKKIILFGSYARGEARPTSDLDLLVIADSTIPRHRRSAPLYGALSKILLPMDIVVFTPEEVQEWSGVRQAFVTTAVREGKVLYEKQD
jgi:predicted nucleotidyltransferase